MLPELQTKSILSDYKYITVSILPNFTNIIKIISLFNNKADQGIIKSIFTKGFKSRNRIIYKTCHNATNKVYIYFFRTSDL